MLSPLSTLESVASDVDRAVAGAGFVRDVTARDDALGSNRRHAKDYHGDEDEDEDELSLSASAAGGKLASALSSIAAQLGASSRGDLPSAADAETHGSGGQARATAAPARTLTVERPSSASVPNWLRYSDAAADRMARAIARRIGMALETTPGSAGLGSARSSASAYSVADSLSSPEARQLPSGAPALHGMGGVLTVGSGSSRQRPPRPSVESTASSDMDADAVAGGWATGSAAGGNRGDATPDSSASTPKKHHRRRLLAPGGAELSLMVDP
jgi:hypothetical protein